MDLSLLKVKIKQLIGKVGTILKLNALNNNRLDIEITKEKIEAKIEADSIIGQIGQLNQTHTEIGSISVVLQGDQLPEDIKQLLGVAQPEAPLLPASPESTGGDVPVPGNARAKKLKVLLENFVSEHNEDQTFLLGVGQLLFFYRHRSNIDFSEAELILLLRSSLKHGFPFWYWSFLYREKFSNVIPLIKESYKTNDVKIRIELVRVLTRFTETAEELCALAETEKNEEILGAMVAALFEGKNEDHAQRVISNAISRRLVPRVELDRIKLLSAELGASEKRFLRQIVIDGWPEEKVFALNLLSVSPSPDDLHVIENVIDNLRYPKAVVSALHCVSRIGRTGKIEVIKKLIDETRSEEIFMQALEVLALLKEKSAFPALFDLVKKPESVHWRLTDLNTWTYGRKLDEAAVGTFDKSHYELVVKEILSKKIWDENWGLYAWRPLHFLKSIEDPEVRSLIEVETRLNEMPEWREVVEGSRGDREIEISDASSLVAKVGTSDFALSERSFKALWKLIPSSEALDYQEYIENLRMDLAERLVEIRKDETLPPEQKNLLKNDLDYFLGDNTLAFGDLRTAGSVSRGKKRDDEKSKLDRLIEDISKFDSIESSFVAFVLTSQNQRTYDFLITQIGRPFEKLYSTLSAKWGEVDKTQLKPLLDSIVNNNPNILIKLRAIEAGLRIGIFDREEARLTVLDALMPVREKLKKEGRVNENSFITQIAYNSCINTLAEIGNPNDLHFIEESANRELIVFRSYANFSDIHSIEAIEKLLNVIELTTDEKDIKYARLALDSLDYRWSAKVLGFEAS
ncbi:MAG: hypothetical protein AAB955_02080 [Patescibacteria group bacterium]